MMNANLSETIFVGDSEMARLMRSRDWSQTPLGAVETWPQSLRSTLSICLNSRFPIAIYWGSDNLLLYNDAWRPIVGNKHPRSLGRPGREVWSEIWDNIGPELASVLATGKGTFHNDELLSMHRFGYVEECFFEYTFNPIQGEGGVIEGVFNVVSETTYRVLNERRARLLREAASKTGAAKTAQEACALIVEALKSDPADIPFALLYLIEPDGKHARLCGGTELTGDNRISPAVIDLTAEDTDGWSIAIAARTAQSQVLNDLVRRFGTLPGSPWPEPPQEAVVLPIAATGQGKVSGVLVAATSPRRRLDDNYHDFLSQVAGQIATAIANARAYEEERKRAVSEAARSAALAELDRAKTTFFNNVSHEFRTPLTLMLGPLEETLYRLDEQLPPSEREQLQMVQRNGLRLLKLVNTLLDFSRIEAGRIQAVYEPTDLAAFTTELASVFRSAIEQAGLRLIVECPPLPELAYVDREMWEKIVLNLLSNAFKFTFEGEIAVRLRSCNDRIELDVRDTGTGIPAEELPHIFERFHRMKGARGRSYEGSGIGLSLVQELVRLHGGTIEVSSIVDRGTCFTVSIPTGCSHLPSESINATRTLTSTVTGAMPYVEELLRWLPKSSESSEAKASELSLSVPVRPQPSSTPTARILLADDNADMRDYLKRLLSQQYEVETVADGTAALAAIRRQRPDLVLTDVMMPRLDGFGLLRELRADPHTQELPIILLSARAGEESRIEGLEAGADDYLTKPFSVRELLARVEANLKLAQLRREATQREQALRLEAEAAQQRVETILSSISDGFYTLDRNWRFTYVNDRVCEMAGKPREALLGYNAWELFPEAVGTNAEIQLHRAMREQTVVQFEYLHSPRNRWFEHRIYPSPDGVTVFLADISDRKRIEAERRQAEAEIQQLNQQLRNRVNELQTLFDLLPVGVAIAQDADCRMIRANPHLSELLRVPIDVNASHSAPPEERPLYRLCRDGEELPVENLPMQYVAIHNTEVKDEVLDLVHPDGTVVKLLSYCSPLLDEQGNVRGALGAFVDITERIQNEAALRESEQRLKIALQTGKLGSWQLHLTTGVLESSDRCKANFGLAPEENLSYQRLFELIHPDDRPYVRETVERAIAQRIDYDAEYRTIWLDGSVHWIIARGRAIYAADGTPTRMIGVTLDITERKQVEEALQESEQQLRLASESAKLGLWHWNVERDILTWTDRCKALFGLPADIEMSYQVFLDALHPDDRQRVQDMLPLLEEGQLERHEIEYRTVWPDGTVRWLAARGSAIYDANQKPISSMGVIFDITDRKQAEQALQQTYEALERRTIQLEEANTTLQDTLEELEVVEEELRQQNSELAIAREVAERETYRYQDLFNFAPDGYVVTDAKGLIQEANQAIADLLALEQSDLINTSLAVYVFESDRRALRNLLYELSCQPQLQKLQTDQLNLAPPKRDAISVAITVTAIRDSQMQLVGARWLIQDITQRKQAEIALSQSEARFRRIFECNVVPMGIWSRSGGIMHANDALLDLIGYTRQELEAGQINWKTLTPPEWLPLDERSLTEIAAKGFSTPFEKEYIHKQGHRVPILIGGASFLDDPDSGIFLAINLTESKRTEAALRQSETILNAFIASSPVGMAYFDRNWRYVYANEALASINGIPLSEHLGRTVREVLPQWAPTIEPIFQQVIQTKAPLLNQEVMGTTYPGDLVRHGLVNYFPVCLPDGEVIGVGITTLDITERKQAQEDLRRSEERLRVSQELSLDAFTILDSLRDETGAIVDFVWTYVNPKAAEILKHPVEELVGQRLLEVLPGNQLNSELFQRYVRVVETGEPHDIELSYNADGIIGWFRNMSVKLEDGVAIFFSDITERKQTEQALRQAEERLRVALQNAPITVFNQDCELKYTWIYNPVLHELDEMLGKCDRDFLPPEDAELLTTIKQRVLETGIGIREEIKLTIDKTYYYDLTVKPLRDATNTIVGITCAAVDISELKQAEIDLRKSEERLRLAMEGAQMGTWDVDLITGKAIWSELHFTMLGYEPTPTGEATEAMWSRRIHPDDVEWVVQEWQQSRQEHRIYRAEYRVIRADNQQIAWLAGLGRFIYNQNGEAIRSIGVLFDITARKQTELALVAQEQRYRYIFEAVNVSIWEEDFSEVKAAINRLKATGVRDFQQYFAEHPEFVQQAIAMVRLRDVNQSTVQLFGAQNKADLLHSLHQIFTPETQEAFIGELLAIATEQTDFAAETVLQTLQGDRLYVWFTITFPPPSELYDRVIVSLVDISDAHRQATQRKQAEAALRESEDRLRLALESAELGTWDFNPIAGELKWDESCKAMFGLPPDAEVTWESTTSSIHPDDRNRVLEMTQWALNPASGGSYTIEYRTVGITDGTERWVAARGQAYFNPNGEAVRFIGTVLNITAQKQAEAEREQLLAREQAAREAAEAANSIKDEFLAIVSHELRSPLNPILGWSKLLRTRQLDKQKTDRALEVIERNAQIQAQLINDLLDVSRILRGKLSLDNRPVDLASTIQAAMETVRLAAEAKSIQIHTQFEPDVGQVLGDAGRLQQVIWNLLSNAVKFTSEGGRVDIRLSSITSPSSWGKATQPRTNNQQQMTSYAQIAVTDTGKGIPPDFLPYVFDRFRQESSATTRRFGGLGLGLAIVRYLVELHGGTVQADSLGEGQGATFTVRLPLIPHQPTMNQETQPSESSLDLQGIRILVVDDEDNTREFLAFLLELHGANAIATATADEAIATLTQFKPDILLSDIGMPDVDGYMLMQQIRALSPEEGGTIPAIALTAYAGEINYQQAMAAGFQRHLAKPIEPDTLIQAISEALNMGLD
jgi:PAS domain S-box-containing protein